MGDFCREGLTDEVRSFQAIARSASVRHGSGDTLRKGATAMRCSFDVASRSSVRHPDHDVRWKDR